MKKVVSVISIILVFLIIYFLQQNFFRWFTIYQVQPNLFLIYAVFIGMFLGKDYGFGTSVIAGLFIDLFCSNIIGITALSLGVVGFLAGVLEKNFSREHKITFLFITTILTVLGEIINYIILLAVHKGEIQLFMFSRILLIEILYNCIIVVIFYPLIQLGGNALSKGLLQEKNVIKYF